MKRAIFDKLMIRNGVKIIREPTVTRYVFADDFVEILDTGMILRNDPDEFPHRVRSYGEAARWLAIRCRCLRGKAPDRWHAFDCPYRIEE